MELQPFQQRVNFEVILINGSKRQGLYEGKSETYAFTLAKKKIAEGAKRLKIFKVVTVFRQPEIVSVILDHKVVAKKKKMLAKI